MSISLGRGLIFCLYDIFKKNLHKRQKNRVSQIVVKVLISIKYLGFF